jgi:hypothetical protein
MSQEELIPIDPAWKMAGKVFPASGIPPELDVQLCDMAFRSRKSRGYVAAGGGAKAVVDAADRLLAVVGQRYTVVRPEDIILHMLRAHMHPTYFGRMGSSSIMRDWVMFDCRGLPGPQSALPTVFMIYSHNKSRVITFRAGFFVTDVFLPIPVEPYKVRHTKSARDRLKSLPEHLYGIRSALVEHQEMMTQELTASLFSDAADIDHKLAPIPKPALKHAKRALQSMLDGKSFRNKLELWEAE